MCTIWGTTLVDGALDGNPPGWCQGGYQCEGGHLVATDGSCETFYNDSRVGWTTQELNRDPGWSQRVLSGGGGIPMVLEYLNHAYYAPDPCKLREVGVMYHRWNDLDSHNFRTDPSGRSYRLGDFTQVEGRFTARRTDELGPPRCWSFPTAYITADFRVWYLDAAGQTVRMDLLGVIVYNLNGWDTDWNSTNVFYWSDGCTAGQCRKLLHGNRLGVATLTTTDQAYVIDYKALLAQYNPPPPGFTINDAVIAGFDVYTSVRGADLDFVVRNVDVVGVRL